MSELLRTMDILSAEVTAALDHWMPAVAEPPGRLHEAMRYSVFAGGKRFRPIVCLLSAEACGAPRGRVLRPAAAIELLHTYTLIHDDLPAMDNDDLRRGQPTLHKVFGEAGAILAGDALLTLAFEWLADCPAPAPHPPGRLARELAFAAGSRGVAGGQFEDLAAEGLPPDAAQLEFIHLHKTAALIEAACRMGAVAAGAPEDRVNRLGAYGRDIGLAFQIADDLLNVTATPEETGKAAHSDARHRKMTYVTLYGPERATVEANALCERALGSLDPLFQKEPRALLQDLARFVLARRH